MVEQYIPYLGTICIPRIIDKTVARTMKSSYKNIWGIYYHGSVCNAGTGKWQLVIFSLNDINESSSVHCSGVKHSMVCYCVEHVSCEFRSVKNSNNVCSLLCDGIIYLPVKFVNMSCGIPCFENDCNKVTEWKCVYKSVK